MSDLPLTRTETMKPPFTNTGIDLFGPITIKQRRARLKRWGALFTCFNTRAIHIESVEGLDTDSFINALVRLNRRGKPEKIFSDCGTNLKGTASELKLQPSQINQFAVKDGITWDFNPPGSPHMGGVWERIVRVVKQVMYSMIKNTVLTDFQLATIFTEIENIRNNRPLTYVSDNIDDFEPLTPNHFLVGKYNSEISTNDNEDISSRKRWKQVQAITKQFWNRWTQEYLPTLQTRKKWKNQEENIKPGTLVLLREEVLRRNKWPLGRILDVYPGKDNVTRVVKVKTATGEYIRPATKIYPLELSD